MKAIQSLTARKIAALSAVFASLLLCVTAFAQQTTPAFTQIILFGDSLSDNGNDYHRVNDVSQGQIGYPGNSFNYATGRFTNDTNTDPPAHLYVETWHEQLAIGFLHIPPAKNSLDGGLNYAFGGATTENGTQDKSVFGSPVSITIDNMGKQMDDYLTRVNNVADPTALYIVWGGGNDIRDNPSATNVSATVGRVNLLLTRLANAGAKYIMVPNLPPIGTIPENAGDTAAQNAKDVASLDYRAQLDSSLNGTQTSLAAQGVNFTLYRVDVWKENLQIYTNPSAFGFVDVRNSAQGKSSVNPDQFLFWDGIHPTTAGHYQIGKAAYETIVNPSPTPAGKTVNLSTRASVGTGEQVSIVGFIITGDVSKKVMVRGLGPSLAAKGVVGALADPTLTLFDNAGNQIAFNDNWQDSDAVNITATGIPPTDPRESAILQSLAPGHYTAVLAGKGNTTGVGLVEVYDRESNTSPVLANLSTRGFVGTGENAMIGGFIINSGDSPAIVVRAIGPSLANSGVANPLMDPFLELHDANGAVIATNDNWRDGQPQAAKATTLNPTDDRESVITAFLAPGNYTAVVQGVGGTTGVALVEAYRIP
ncbi:MAG: SGNH/GDSL hydrolase family protein [Chthoniobacterales bacterium]